MPLIDDEGRRVTTKPKKKPKPKPKPKPSGKKVSWKSLLLGGRSIRVNSSYHSGGRGTAGRGGWHTGADLAASTGTHIRIPLSGTVVSTGRNGPFGNVVMVKLANGDFMQFAHLSSIGVYKGQKLKVGSYIGRTGSTGNVTGPHLHLEIRRASSGGRWSRNDKTFYDPVEYLNAHAKGVVVGSSGKSSGSVGGGSGGGGGGGGGGSSTTYTNTKSGGGGGGGGGKVAFSKKEFYADLETMFGDLDVLLALDAEARKKTGGRSIRWAIDQAVKQKITDSDRFLTLLNKTAWFKVYGKETTMRLVEERAKPGLFKANMSQIQAAIQQQAANLGVVLESTHLNRLARDAYVFQWEASSATVLDRIQKLANTGQGKYAGGQIGESVEAVETFAREYGVELSDSDLKQLRNDILDGLGDQRMRDTLQKRSAQAYEIYGDQIMKGVNLRSLMDPYLQVAAQLLEVSPEEVDMDDPLFTRGMAFQKPDENTGKMVQRSLAEFERMVRHDKRWTETDNARKSTMDLSTGLLKTMGLM